MVKNMKCLVFDSPKGLCKYFPSNFATKNMIFIYQKVPQRIMEQILVVHLLKHFDAQP